MPAHVNQRFFYKAPSLGNVNTVALCHLKWALESANPLILEQPLKRTIEDNLFLLFFLSGWTKNKWIRTFQWQKATVWSMEGSGECES